MRRRESPRSRRFPLLLAAGASGLTLLGLLGLANEVAAGRLRAWERARALARLAADEIGREVDRLAVGPSPEVDEDRPDLLLAFSLDASGRLLRPGPPMESEPAPEEERARVETFLDEAAYREFARGDPGAARLALDRAGEAATHPALAASVDLARAAYDLRRGDASRALERVESLAGGMAPRTDRNGLPVSALARLLAVRAHLSLGKQEAARGEAGDLVADLEGAGAIAYEGFLVEMEEKGLVDEEGLRGARERLRATADRRRHIEILVERGPELVAASEAVPVGGALAVLGPRSPAGRAGFLVDPKKFLREVLPRPAEIARAEGVSVVDARGEPVAFEAVVPGTSGALAIGLPLGFEPAEPGWGRVLLLAGLLLVFGTTIVAGATRMARATRREVEAARAKSEFLAGVTHELKTPLTSIRLYGEMLEDGRNSDEGKRRAYVGTIRREAERLTALIDRVLALARRERGAAAETREIVRAGAIVHEAESAFRPVAESEGCVLDVALADGDADLRVDPAGVVQVLLDLLDNARKYGGSDRRIELSGRRDGATYVIEVADRGRGISAAEAGRLFEMFARGEDPESREKPGLGIGLALAKRVVEANGGSIEVRPREGGGSVFAVRLPLAEVAAG